MSGINKGNQVSLKATNEFISLIPTLKINELLQIEFRIDNVWKKMVVCRNHIQKMYHCNVCNVVQYGEKNLFGHVVGKKHKLQMVPVKQLYLIKYTLPKNANESSIECKTKSQENKEPGKAGSSAVVNSPLKTKNANGAAAVSAANSKNTVGTIAKPPNSSTQTKQTAVKPTTTTKLAASVEQQRSKAATQSTSTKAPQPTSKGSIAKTTPTPAAAPTVKNPPARATPVKTTSIKTETEVPKTTVEQKAPPNTKVIPVRDMTKVPTTTLPKTTVNTKAIPVKVTSQISTSVLAKKTVTVNTKVTTTKVLKEIPTGTPAKTTSLNVKAVKINVTAQNSSTIPAKTPPVITKAPPVKITDQMAKPKQEMLIPKKETVKLPLEIAGTAPIEDCNAHNVKEEPNVAQIKNIDPALSADSIVLNDTEVPNESLLEMGSEQLLKDEEVVRTEEIILENPIAKNSNNEKGRISCKSFAKLGATDSFQIEVINIDDDDDDNVDADQIKDAAISLNESTERESACISAKGASKKVVSKESDTNKKKHSEMSKKQAPHYAKNRIIIPSTVTSKNSRNTIARNKNQQQDELDSEIITFDTESINLRNRENIEGLVGVEYVIKIQINYSDKSKRYECCLCELVLTGRAMQNHLLGYNHRLKFCEKHFPTAIRQYRQYMVDVPEHEIFKVMTPILDKLAIAIEEHHGRERPFQCYDRDFNRNRSNYISKVFSSRHASEQHGPSFTHVIDAKEVDQLIQNRHNFRPRKSMYVQKVNVHLGESTVTTCEISGFEQQQQEQHQYQPQHMLPHDNTRHIMHTNQETGYVDDETHRLMVEDFLKGTNMGDRSRPHRNRERDRFRSTSRGRKRRRSRSNSRSSQSARKHKCRSISPLREGDIWQAYRHMVDQKLKELENSFAQYKKDPETHPLYNEQWQKFWKRRKDELIAAGIDHRKYNYQNEWVLFFKARMEQLHSQDVETVKIQCRERLYLPMVNDEVLDSKYHVHVLINHPETNSSAGITNFTNSYQVQSMANNNEAVNREKDRMDTQEHVEETSNSQVPNVIHVLRILTALEEFLGSLGPKITEMLSKALILDKTNPAGVDNLFNTREHCAVLETAKEKFKGLVIAGLLDPPKDRALRKAISETDRFLTITLQKIKEAEHQRQIDISQEHQFVNKPAPHSTTFFSSQTVPFNHPNAGVPAAPVSTAQQVSESQVLELNQIEHAENLTKSEKSSLASKLAASLIAQGKTNFEPNQLRQIIEIYSLIEKKKREENQGIPATNSSSAFSNSNNAAQNTLLDSMTQLTASSGGRGDNDSGRSSLPSHTVNTAKNSQTNVQFNERGTSSSAFQSNTNSTATLQNTLNPNWRTSSGNGSGGYGDYNSGIGGFTARGANSGIARGSNTNTVGCNNTNVRAANRNISGSYTANTAVRDLSNTNTNMNNMNTSGNSFSQNVPSTSMNFNQFNPNQSQLQGPRGLNRNSGHLFNSQPFVESYQGVHNQSTPSPIGNSIWSNNNVNNVTGSSGGSMFNQNRTFSSNNNSNLNNQSNNFIRGDQHRPQQQWHNRFN